MVRMLCSGSSAAGEGLGSMGAGRAGGAASCTFVLQLNRHKRANTTRDDRKAGFMIVVKISNKYIEFGYQ
jgi:hypothetical protein